jgi:hypothetical protein
MPKIIAGQVWKSIFCFWNIFLSSIVANIATSKNNTNAEIACMITNKSNVT